MPTDNERREVARRLRGLEVCELDGEFIDCGEVEGALGLVSDDGAWYEAEGVMRLADLIEPPHQCPYYDSLRHRCSFHDVPAVDRDALLALADICESTGNVYDSCRSEAVDGALVGLLRETTEFELKDGPYRLKDGPYRQRGAGGEPMDENHFANLIIALAAVYVIGFVVIVLAIYATA